MGGTNRRRRWQNGLGKYRVPRPLFLYKQISISTCRRVVNHTAHSPKLHISIITSGDHQGHFGVEGDPIDTAVMSIKDKSYASVGVAKHVCLLLVGTSHLVLEGHRCWCRMLLSQARNVPNPDATIQRGTDDEILLRVKLSAHGVMTVSGQGSN